MASRAVDPSWVADKHCADINNGGRWLGGGVVEPGHARDRGGIDQGVEAAVRRLDRTWAGAAGRPGRGGAGGVEELGEAPAADEAVAWRSWPRRAVGGMRQRQASQGGGWRAPAGRQQVGDRVGRWAVAAIDLRAQARVGVGA
jgi:hypothetical protein